MWNLLSLISGNKSKSKLNFFLNWHTIYDMFHSLSSTTSCIKCLYNGTGCLHISNCYIFQKLFSFMQDRHPLLYVMWLNAKLKWQSTQNHKTHAVLTWHCLHQKPFSQGPTKILVTWKLTDFFVQATPPYCSKPCKPYP